MSDVSKLKVGDILTVKVESIRVGKYSLPLIKGERYRITTITGEGIYLQELNVVEYYVWVDYKFVKIYEVFEVQRLERIDKIKFIFDEI